MFIGLLGGSVGSFGASLSSNVKGPIKCLSLYNQSCQARPALVNTISEEALFYPFTVRVNKCGGSCNTRWYICSSLCSNYSRNY